jgi:hypothetical protein
MAMGNGIDGPRNPDEVLFITRTPEARSMALASPLAVVTRTMKEVTDDWRVVSAQVLQMVSSVESETIPKGFTLGEITVSLGFTASGKLAFIAEAGIEASVELTFRKPEQTSPRDNSGR